MAIEMKSKYIEFPIIMSYNATLNFVLGGRNRGKTVGAWTYIVNKCTERNKRFIYLRRRKEEVKSKKISKVFNDINNLGLVKAGNISYKDGGRFFIGDKEIGQAIALTEYAEYKSIAMPDVEYILFEEFLIEDTKQHKYLQDEPSKLLNLYESINRLRTGKDRVKVIAIGNYTTWDNPYFYYFNVKRPEENTNIVRAQKNKVLVYLDNDEAFKKERRETDFGELIDGTPYEEYSIENNSLLDNETFIKKRTSKAINYFGIKYGNHLLGVWADMNAGEIYISEKCNPQLNYIFAVTKEDMTPNTLFLSVAKKKTYWRFLATNYANGNVYYENMTIKNLFHEVARIGNL